MTRSLEHSRAYLADLTKRAEAHPRADVVTVLPEILQHARSTYRDLSQGIARIAKAEVTGEDAEALTDRLLYDYAAATDMLADALAELDGHPIP
jgi:hypothetical protein